MGEYVDIRTSPGEIIGIANNIRSKGLDMVRAVSAANDAIRTHEGKGETFPDDQFTRAFKKHYDEPVPGADGNEVEANEAIKQSAVYCGTKLAEIGDFVNTAMTNYETTDDASGDDIAKTV